MALRDAAQHKEGGNIFLIGLEREIPNTFTLVDLKGNTGKKYSLGFYFSEKPRRRNAGEGWPKTPEDNLERLKDAGFPMDALVIKCGRCAGMRFLISITAFH
ncbi:hypothetical protein EJ05DRAFT_480391 [Pseudovirgaria hyperparasitica]|uniref:Uncharacterized protein n=1 Tax=Pseudovirgaria hyperparasitica TaxID=470096 RepID=A0A6A6VUB5_9PEZI|nr:uncharacterized protein EJ05DRAFT_480391 [Pseudovirgaria hyperparasitica]KAF2753376.1 hypothetical protein EJ05DRAFT_480391 [Pseudovirgaria hyperparasitica]